MKIEEHNDSDLSENEEQYSKLASDISQLDSTQRVKAATRKELSSVISEFHLPKVNAATADVNVNELVSVLRGKTFHDKISKKVKSVTKRAKTLPKPLEKPVAEKIKRSLGYNSVVNQLQKWRGVVTRNRVSDQLNFPLQQERITLQSSHQYLSKFKDETPLEIEMAKILNKEQEEEVKEMEKVLGENIEFPLTLEEIMEKRKEMAKLRAKMSYREAKAYRQSKIKSKKYHRILKREKIKQQLKDFEQLQKSDPAAALKKLEILDKARAQERASLRHKNTGKWAKNMAIRAKYDKESRKVLAEQLKLSRDLTEKVKNIGSDDDMSDTQEDDKSVSQTKVDIPKDNPWSLEVSSEVTDFISGYKKFWENKDNASKQLENPINSANHKETSVIDEKTGVANDVDLNCSNKNKVKNSSNRLLENPKATVVNPDNTHINEISKGEQVKDETVNSNNTDSKSSLTNGFPESIRKSRETSKGPSSNNERTKKGHKNEKPAKELVKLVEQKKKLVNGSNKITEFKTKISEGTKKTSSVKNVKQPSDYSNSDKQLKKKKRLNSSTNQIHSGDIQRVSNIKGKPLKEKSTVFSTSGLWTVIPLEVEEETASNENCSKRKSSINIDNLFDELDEELSKKTTSKLEKIKKRLDKGKKKKIKKKKSEKANGSDSESEMHSLFNKNSASVRPDVDEALLETTGKDAAQSVTNEVGVDNTGNMKESVPVSETPPEIDPKKFIEVKPKKLKTRLPDNITGDDDYIDDEEKEQRLNIIEAFEGDDVMEEFEQMKKQEEESTKLELPDSLPGWGSWGGTGIKVTNRKVKRFMDTPKLPPRKDKDKKDMIINEKANSKIVNHMVKLVPYPFKSVGAFEANLRHPIGREWVPETAHREFIKKPVETRLGTIIEPMDERELLNFKKKTKSLYRGKTKGKADKK